jgi:hypothetical protein
LAGIALEVAALAFLGYVLMDEDDAPRYLGRPSIPRDDAAATAPPAAEPAATALTETVSSEPMDFITESADSGARYYRASGSGVEMFAGFYSDGRLRLVDPQNRRFAGLVQGGHADLLQLDNNQWSEVLVSTTPSGTIQLELRGGPYDARVLTCENLP